MAGNWHALNNQPTFSASTMLLLTDGTVMCQDGGGTAWWKLTPDLTGDYINGTWSPLASMHHTRLYYASAVLRDGRVIISGGEYSDAGSETNTGELYYPTLDMWVEIPSPLSWSEVGDAACCVLPDGRLLVSERTGQLRVIRNGVLDGHAHQALGGENGNWLDADAGIGTYLFLSTLQHFFV